MSGLEIAIIVYILGFIAFSIISGLKGDGPESIVFTFVWPVTVLLIIWMAPYLAAYRIRHGEWPD